MKIVANHRNLKDLVYKNVYYSIMCTQEHIVLEGTRYTAVVEGVIYRIQNRLCRHMNKSDIVSELTPLLSKSKDTFTSHLEGIYVIAVNDNENNILYIFRSDAVSYDLYYKPGIRKYVVFSDIKDLFNDSLLDFG